MPLALRYSMRQTIDHETSRPLEIFSSYCHTPRENLKLCGIRYGQVSREVSGMSTQVVIERESANESIGVLLELDPRYVPGFVIAEVSLSPCREHTHGRARRTHVIHSLTHSQPAWSVLRLYRNRLLQPSRRCALATISFPYVLTPTPSPPIIFCEH